MIPSQLLRIKYILPSTLLLILILNITLYKFHEPTSNTIDELWIKYTTNSVDKYRLTKMYEPTDVRVKLADAFPYEKNSEPLPRQIWQMWKNDDIKSLDKGLQDLIATWRDQRGVDKGGFKYELLGDDRLNSIVVQEFNKVPEVIEAFHKFPTIILKSDLMRYLLVFAYGGVYSDIDTSLTTDLDQWLTYNNTYVQENKIGMVLGIESYRDDKRWIQQMPRKLQFCQWTLQGKKGHPFLRELIYRIVDLGLNHYDSKTKILSKNGKKYDMNDGSPTKYDGIMEWTGPAMFTDVVFDYLNEVYKTTEKLNPGKSFAETSIVDPNPSKHQKKIKYNKPKDNGFLYSYDPINTPYGWQNMSYAKDPILFDDDVVLLPQAFFGGHSEDMKREYVLHHFQGSWKG